MPPRILIVDANARMRRTIRQVVEDSTDLQVCGEGTDGQDAVRQAEKLQPDLVILDLTMPKMNGLQVARAIKQLLPKVRLVLFSLEENQLVGNAAKAVGGMMVVLSPNHRYLSTDSLRYVAFAAEESAGPAHPDDRM